MAKKSGLNAEQREQLVRLLRREEPAAQMKARAGISEQTLYRWREEFINAGKQALNGCGADGLQGREGGAA